jgi:hypothetical protein
MAYSGGGPSSLPRVRVDIRTPDDMPRMRTYKVVTRYGIEFVKAEFYMIEGSGVLEFYQVDMGIHKRSFSPASWRTVEEFV